ncbi:MAG: ATP-binding protein, partial [Lachnospiraceae bacterium]
YLGLWQEEKSFEENVKRLFLTENAPLFSEAERYLKQELRELSAYNTILAALAQGKYKLNDIYEQTGFSRAKISVYLKNLTQIDITEKLYSFATKEYQSVQKGLYRIREPYLCFWYRFIYPNLSAIAAGEGERVYKEAIAPFLADYVGEAFCNVCGEYLQLMSRYQRLERTYESFGVWYGKTGRIDVLAKAEDGAYLAAFCDCKETPTGTAAYKEYAAVLESAGVTPAEWYCFSMQGFSKEMEQLAGQKKIRLVCAKDM